MKTAFILDNKDPIIQNFDLDFINIGSNLDHDKKEYFVNSVNIVYDCGTYRRTVRAISTGRINVNGNIKVGGNYARIK